MKLETVFDTDDEVVFLYTWFLRRDKKTIDNFIFYLNYHATCVIYLTACLIITVSMYIMDPIECIADQMVDEVIDNFCFYHSTFSITNLSAIEATAGLQPHPGIGPKFHDGGGRSNLSYHHYYLWVAPFLVLQGVTFYIPRGLWKSWEGSRLKFILDEKDSIQSISSSSSEGTFHKIASYISSKAHKSYFCKLAFCEVLNLVNAVVQLYVMELFLGYGLINLYENWLHLINESKVEERPLEVDLMFPKVTSCKFYSFGTTGNKVPTDALCVLPVNVINEKVFGILHLWIAVVLIPLSALALVYRLLSYIFRKQILKSHLLPNVAIDKDHELNILKKKLDMGNWQLLQVAGWNMDSWALTNIVDSLLGKLCRNDRYSGNEYE